MRQLILVALLGLAALTLVPTEASANPLTPCVTSPVGVIVLGHAYLYPNEHLAGCASNNPLQCAYPAGYINILGSYTEFCLP